MRTLLSRIMLSLGLVFGLSGAAVASVINFDLTTGNPAISGYSGPYVAVQVSLIDATHAQITFSHYTIGTIQYFMGAQGAMALNVSGAFSIDSMFCALVGCGPLSSGGAGNEDGWGNFNLTIDSFDGFGSKATFIELNISATGTNTWADAAHVLTPNAGGSIAAAHIFVVDPDCPTGAGGACATGYAAGTGGGAPPVPVPEPQTLALLGLGLLVGLARRRQVG